MYYVTRMSASSVCRVLKWYLATLHIVIFVFSNWSEVGACDYTDLPNASVFSDAQVARDRTFQGVYFYSAAVLEMLLVCTCILLSRKTAHGVHDLKGASRWLPLCIIVINMCFRARYVYSTPYDSKACGALNCPTTPISYSLDNCKIANGEYSFIKINWGNRRNWCPMPEWYRTNPYAATHCAGLKNTPDAASCYRYGCNTQTGMRYYTVRILIWNAFLFAIVALVPYTMAGGTAGNGCSRRWKEQPCLQDRHGLKFE